MLQNLRSGEMQFQTRDHKNSVVSKGERVNRPLNLNCWHSRVPSWLRLFLCPHLPSCLSQSRTFTDRPSLPPQQGPSVFSGGGGKGRAPGREGRERRGRRSLGVPT
ncbi:unnamed protein product [Ixodes pacificus]